MKFQVFHIGAVLLAFLLLSPGGGNVLWSDGGPVMDVVAGGSEEESPPGSKGNPHAIPMTDAEIDVDGRLEEPLWKEALLLELKYEVEPGENTAAPVKTELLLIHSSTHIYAAFRCYDPRPERIRAHLSDRDKDMGDDFVAVALDTFNDGRSNYILWSNPRGVQEDAIMSDSDYQVDWDALYDSQGRIYSWGYSVEFAIPFSSLRFQRSKEAQVWGIDAWRNYPRDRYHVMGLFPRDRGSNCYQCQMIKIRGFEAARPGRSLELSPAITGVTSASRPDWPDGDMEEKDKTVAVGLSGKWGVTPNLTLNGAVNPDFSQVEADARQLDINTPFALYYNEKRPFFTEGMDFFNSPINVIYTRTMRDPAWGIKLTGKEGNHSVGAFLVRDELTHILIPGVHYSDSARLTGGSTAAAVRYRRDFGANYTFGALAAVRDGVDYKNGVFGLDGNLRFSKSDSLVVQYLGSVSRYPEDVALEFDQPQGNFGGGALSLFYSHNARKYNITATYLNIDGRFRADLGHMPRVGRRDFTLDADYRWIAEPGKWWSQFILYGGVFNVVKQNNELLSRGALASLIFSGALNSRFDITFKSEREAFEGLAFDMTRWQFRLQFIPVGGLKFFLSANIGDFPDYDNVRPGKRALLNGSIQWSIGSHLHVLLENIHERMNVRDIRLYTANIAQCSLVYQFSTRMMTRVIAQYIRFDYNPANYLFDMPELEENLYLQFLFSYKLNPRTVLFLGYTDSSDGDVNTPLTRKSRSLFMKIGYAWQL